MKKIMTGIVVAALSTSLITGCSSNTQAENTGIGAVSGAAVGGVASGLLGGNPVAIGVSAVAGALIGGYIGHSMDSTDKSSMNTAMTGNATNMPSTWTNPKTGIVYNITPTSDMMTVNGNPNCRTYKASAIVKGKKHYSRGTACRQSDGSWVMTKH